MDRMRQGINRGPHTYMTYAPLRLYLALTGQSG